MTNQAILEQALRQRTAAQRAAYLEQACAGDLDRRRHIEALLRDHHAAGGGIDRPRLKSPEQHTLSRNPAETRDAAGADASSQLPGETSAMTRAEDEGGDELSLPFLAPANRSGVLGRMDHYEVLEIVGKGGMGLVLKAFDTKLYREVAIKVMAPYLAVNATARKRFVREAQAGAAINHKHVVAIHAVEAQHRPPYLVMEFVAGRSLADKLRQEAPPELQEILRIGSEIALGLAAAHAGELIHRDIKPANILLENKTDRVKITDFGLARAANDASLTQSG